MRIYRLLGVAVLATLGLVVPGIAAGTPSISITSPAAGAGPIASAEVPVSVSTQNFNVECRTVGLPPKPGRGHIHAMVDGMTMKNMTNFYCSKEFSFSGAGLKAGMHTLVVILASDDHANVGKPAIVKFDYEPTSPVPLPQPVKGAKPSVKIVSPQNGTVVGRTVDLKVAVSNFKLSCDLEGKPDVTGYGHLHLFVNQGGKAMTMMAEPMKGEKGAMKGEKGGMKGEKAMKHGMAGMSMLGMVSMPCTTTIPVDLSAWQSGKTTLLVMLADNDHEPTPGVVPSSVRVTVK